MSKVRKVLWISGSWLMHEVGHFISKVMEWFDWECLYPAYHWCMLVSADLDEWGVIWENVNE